MRLYIFIALIMTFSSLRSQESIGYYFDRSGNELTGYVEHDYEGEAFARINMISNSTFIEGYYIDEKEEKIEGFLKGPNLDGLGYTSFRFSEFKDGSKSTKIKADDIQLVKTKLDSFIVGNDLKMGNRALTPVRGSRFLSVVLENEKFTLLSFMSSGKTHFYYYDKTEKDLKPLPDRSKFLTPIVAELLGDCTPLTKKLEKNIEISDIVSLGKIYEVWLKYKNGYKIFFDSDWNEIDRARDSYGYGEISAFRDSIFTIEYFTDNNRKIFEGQFSSLSPKIRNGEFKWYYSDGIIRKECIYRNNELNGACAEYFKNGRLHRKFKYLNGTRHFEEVYDSLGKTFMTDGNGVEKFYDQNVFSNRILLRQYQQNEIVSSYYIASNGKKIYQWCDKLPVNKKGMPFNVMNYPESEFSSNKQASVIAKVLIGTRGNIIRHEFIESSGESFNSEVEKFFMECKKMNFPIFKSAKHEGEAVIFETILSFNFGISGINKNRSTNYDWSFMNQMHFQMMMNQPININPPSLPSGF